MLLMLQIYKILFQLILFLLAYGNLTAYKARTAAMFFRRLAAAPAGSLSSILFFSWTYLLDAVGMAGYKRQNAALRQHS